MKVAAPPSMEGSAVVVTPVEGYWEQLRCWNATTCGNSIGIWIGSRSRIEGSGRWWGVSVVGWVAIMLLILRSWWFIYIRRLSLLERVWGGRTDRGGKNVLASALVMVHLQEMTDMFLRLSLLVVVNNNNNNNNNNNSHNSHNMSAKSCFICAAPHRCHPSLRTTAPC